jgi:monosaccharide-transporting ATPase
VLLARWLATQPSCSSSTSRRAASTSAPRQEIEQLIAAARRRPGGAVHLRSELEEVVRTSSRVVVLRDRRHRGELAGAEINSSRPSCPHRRAHERPDHG